MRKEILVYYIILEILHNKKEERKTRVGQMDQQVKSPAANRNDSSLTSTGVHRRCMPSNKQVNKNIHN